MCQRYAILCMQTNYDNFENKYYCNMTTAILRQQRFIDDVKPRPLNIL